MRPPTGRFLLAGLVFVWATAACRAVGTEPDPGDEPDPAPPPDTLSASLRAYAAGPLLYLERTRGVDTLRLALDTRWGGTIVELSLGGVNVVNAHDTGREIQAAFYDGADQYDACAACTGTWGWNPVQGGDRWNAGSGVLASSLTGDSLYVRVRPLEWYPDNKGGGAGRPIESDVILEQWVAAVPAAFTTFRVRYRLTHLGSDDHAVAGHEVPAVYATVGHDRIVHYAGPSPWTGRPVTIGSLATLGGDLGPERYMAEYWAALIDASGRALTVYMPGSLPYVNGFLAPGAPGPQGDGTTYFRSVTPFGIEPGAVVEAEVYVIAGHHTDARQVVYTLRPSAAVPDILWPFGALDEPSAGSTVSGTISVAGWALDNVAVTRVDILVDDVVAGTATYGVERQDVAAAYPGAPVNAGYEYVLDTSSYPNGPHVIVAVARDAAGHAGRMAATVTVAN